MHHLALAGFAFTHEPAAAGRRRLGAGRAGL